MKQTDEFRRFVKEHAGDDLTRLLLSASRYPSIDVPFAVDQIASRRQLFLNLPPCSPFVIEYGFILSTTFLNSLI